MLSSIWKEIYLGAINGLCANKNMTVESSSEYSKIDNVSLISQKIIDHAIAIANIGDKNFEKLEHETASCNTHA